MKCFHCKQTFAQKEISANRKVFPKTCINCGKPRSPRESLRSGKPNRK